VNDRDTPSECPRSSRAIAGQALELADAALQSAARCLRLWPVLPEALHEARRCLEAAAVQVRAARDALAVRATNLDR
jgi:hypothetical protein